CSELTNEPDTACGTCDSGTWSCDGTDDVICEGDLEDDALNACRGCADLGSETPGQSCGTCGQWVCDGTEATTCQDDGGGNACGGCTPLPEGFVLEGGCGTCNSGTWSCTGTTGACVGDLGSAALNDCGGCAE